MKWIRCTVRKLWWLNIIPSDPTHILLRTEFLVNWSLFSSNSWVLVISVFHSFRSVMSRSSRDLEALSHSAVEEENTFTIILVISFTILRKVLPFYHNCVLVGDLSLRQLSHCSWKCQICFLLFTLFSIYLYRSFFILIYFSLCIYNKL